MLANFTIHHQFNKLRLTLVVDRTRCDAELMITYDHRIIQPAERVDYILVSIPAIAEAWFSRPMGERGNFIEWLEWVCHSKKEEAEIFVTTFLKQHGTAA